MGQAGMEGGGREHPQRLFRQGLHRGIFGVSSAETDDPAASCK